MEMIIENSTVFLSYRFLQTLGVGYNTIKHWSERRTAQVIYRDGNAYVKYQSIPAPTRLKRLPSEESLIALFNENTKRTEVDILFCRLEQAYFSGYSKYLKLYIEDSPLSSEKATKFAQLHAVIQSIIDLKEKEGLRDLRGLYEAFNRLYPGKYQSKHVLSNAIRKAMSDGIMSVALDKRAFGNNKEANSKKFSPIQKFWLSHLIGHPAKLTCTQIHAKLVRACEEADYHKPSIGWVKKWRQILLKNPVLFKSRYGQQEASRIMPFASLHHATYVNSQWQMDGWTLPFWGPNFKRYVLVRLIDNCSKKIVGYSFGESEDTPLIMEAIRDSINKTEELPFEVLTDNHAFNKTQEAKNLISLFAKKGARWTVTQNPQYKAIIERYNQYLDNICREYYGWLGQGVRSKSIDALAKPELIDEYAKNFLSKEEIKGYAILAVETYNRTAQKDGKSPNEKYEANKHPHPLKALPFDRAELLTMQTEKMVRRGQITILRGVVKHEFQFSSEYFQKVNGSTVIVRYDNLHDGIYVFEKETGEPIVFLAPKKKISGAKADQTEKDIEALNRHAGRIDGINTKAKKELEQLTATALEIDPEAYARINKLTTPKSIVKQLTEDSDLRHAAADNDLKEHLLTATDRTFPSATAALMPKEKTNDKPFSVKNNTIEVIDVLKDLDEE